MTRAPTFREVRAELFRAYGGGLVLSAMTVTDVLRLVASADPGTQVHRVGDRLIEVRHLVTDFGGVPHLRTRCLLTGNIRWADLKAFAVIRSLPSRVRLGSGRGKVRIARWAWGRPVDEVDLVKTRHDGPGSLTVRG